MAEDPEVQQRVGEHRQGDRPPGEGAADPGGGGREIQKMPVKLLKMITENRSGDWPSLRNLSGNYPPPPCLPLKLAFSEVLMDSATSTMAEPPFFPVVVSKILASKEIRLQLITTVLRPI